jgi:hypothetical protein
MHAVFAPLAWASPCWRSTPAGSCSLFMLLLLVYRGALSGQIPLYFSNRPTAAALAALTTPIPRCASSTSAPASAACSAARQKAAGRPLHRRRERPRHLAVGPPAHRSPGQLRLALGRSLANRPSPPTTSSMPSSRRRRWLPCGRSLAARCAAGSLFISNSFAVPGCRRHARHRCR